MSNLAVTLPTGTTVCHGKQITFRAPCNCKDVTGIIIGGITYSLVDANNKSISDNGTQFINGAMVSVIIDTENSRAYIQNTGAHLHKVSDISDFPKSMPASDVYDWAKAAEKPSYSASEIKDFPSEMTPSAHNQSADTITEGTLAGRVNANATAAETLNASTLRNIYIRSTDMTAGTSTLTTGSIALVYE